MCNTPRHSSWRDVCAAGAWLLSNISAALSRSKATQKCFVYCLKSKALPVCQGLMPPVSWSARLGVIGLVVVLVN